MASVRTSVRAPLDFTFEHLVYDNGSRDGTAAYLRKAAAGPGPPLRHRHSPGRQLAGLARNVSIIGVDANRHNANLRVIFDKYREQLEGLGVAGPG